MLILWILKLAINNGIENISANILNVNNDKSIDINVEGSVTIVETNEKN